MSVWLLEKCVPLLKASQVSFSPSSSRETLWVMLDMVVIPPWLPCGWKTRTVVQAGDRGLRSLTLSFLSKAGKKKQQKPATMLRSGEY